MNPKNVTSTVTPDDESDVEINTEERRWGMGMRAVLCPLPIIVTSLATYEHISSSNEQQVKLQMKHSMGRFYARRFAFVVMVPVCKSVLWSV